MEEEEIKVIKQDESPSMTIEEFSKSIDEELEEGAPGWKKLPKKTIPFSLSRESAKQIVDEWKEKENPKTERIYISALIKRIEKKLE